MQLHWIGRILSERRRMLKSDEFVLAVLGHVVYIRDYHTIRQGETRYGMK